MADQGVLLDVESGWDNDTWLTPRWILDQLGRFDLDPCAAAAAPFWVCGGAMTPAEDGLVQPWLGRVFMNPPFSCIWPWVEQMAKHGNGIALLPAGHDTEAWERYVWGAADSIFLLRGRIRFAEPNGLNSRGRPRVPVALVAYSKTDAAVLRDFQGAGVLLKNWSVRKGVNR